MIEHASWLVAGGIVAIVHLVILLRGRKPDPHEEPHQRTRRRVIKGIMVVTRTLAILLIFGALAGPFVTEQIFAEQSPEITVLLDNSTSMSVLDLQSASDLIDALREEAPLRVLPMGGLDRSALGDDVLAALSQDANLLLVTDGHATSGVSLEAAAGFAQQINATLNAVQLQPRVRDAAIWIDPPRRSATTR